MEKQLYTVKETAAITGLSVSSLYRLFGAGRLDSVRIGGARRVPRDAIERLIDQNRHAPGEPVLPLRGVGDMVDSVSPVEIGEHKQCCDSSI